MPLSSVWSALLALCSLLLSLPAVASTQWDPSAVAAWSDSVVRLSVGSATCSGVVIDELGTVATAYHCVATVQRPQVERRDGGVVTGRVVATSPSDDLALVLAPELGGAVPALPLRTEPVLPGLAVLAIGHPFGGAPATAGAYAGTLSWSVSQGIVSAAGERLVQTDAALNPGTSGGPVVDEQGRIIGIVSRKLGGEGVSFLAHVDRLAALLAEPRGAGRLGGTVAVGFTLPTPIVAGAARSLGVRVDLSLRDRLVAGVGIGLPVDARVQALAWGRSTFQSLEGTLALRQRLGHGAWSTLIDVGGGAWQLVDVTAESSVSAATSDDGEDEVLIWTVQRPRSFAGGLTGRIAARSMGLRVSWLPGDGTWVLGVDVMWPGVLGTF